MGADDCGGPELLSGPCDICAQPIVGLHMHVQTGPATDPRTLGFCSEECAGRWRNGEPVTADRGSTFFELLDLMKPLGVD